jgi:molecular chaperone GrpE
MTRKHKDEQTSTHEEHDDEKVVKQETLSQDEAVDNEGSNDDTQDQATSDEGESTEEVQGAAAPATQPVDEISIVKAQAEEYLNNWKRAAADFQNYKKQQDRDRQNWIALANAELILRLLPVADDLDKALSEVTDDVKKSKWYEGIALIRKKLADAFSEMGLTEIAALGAKFDPAYHEAVLEEQIAGAVSGTVTAVLQKGYMLSGKVIRAAMVKVAK